MTDEKANEFDVEEYLQEQRDFLTDPVNSSYYWNGRRTDWFLQKLVNLANGEAKLEFGLTLTVEGQIVTGTLISHETYFKEFAAAFAGALPNGDSEGEVQRVFENLGAPSAGGDLLPMQYICLRAARHLMGNSFAPASGMLWRGKISSVSGFSLGTLQSA